MVRRQPHCRAHSKSLPRLWLVTDERVDMASLLRAAARMPRGSGIVFRHHATPGDARRRLYNALHALAWRRGLVLVVAGTARLALGWRADGFHGRSSSGAGDRRLIRTAPAHDLAQLRAAERGGADIIFVSPVFATRSHPGGRTLGRVRFAALVRHTKVKVIAMGGMDAKRAASLGATGAYGWAAIDALSG